MGDCLARAGAVAPESDDRRAGPHVAGRVEGAGVVGHEGQAAGREAGGQGRLPRFARAAEGHDAAVDLHRTGMERLQAVERKGDQEGPVDEADGGHFFADRAPRDAYALSREFVLGLISPAARHQPGRLLDPHLRVSAEGPGSDRIGQGGARGRVGRGESPEREAGEPQPEGDYG